MDEGLGQGHAFPHGKKLLEVRLPLGFGGCRERILIEEGDRYRQGPRDFQEPPGADAVFALLVFLNLLERDAEDVRQLLLAHAQRHALETDACADILIDEARSLGVKGRGPESFDRLQLAIVHCLASNVPAPGRS
jgi:hypothetical protein